MTSLIKTITSVLKASTDHITNIPARPIGLAEIVAIMFVSTFKMAIIFLVSWLRLLLICFQYWVSRVVLTIRYRNIDIEIYSVPLIVAHQNSSLCYLYERSCTKFPITTKVVSSNPVVYLIQLYVIKFVSGLRQVSGFLWVLRFPSPIKLKYCWKWH